MDELLRASLALWRDCPTTLPALPRTFTVTEQATRERQFDRFLEGIQNELKSIPRSRSERLEAQSRITDLFTRFARESAGLEDRHLELLGSGGLSEVGTRLARQARRFDPSVSTSDILQATRNAWTACGLQMLFGRKMCLTPSIFAYSMLYPYTDNYLDDVSTSEEDKRGFSRRLGARLAGDEVGPANDWENLIWRLVGLIEGEHPRPACPRIYESLLDIHRAQGRSIALLRSGADADVLGIVFEKGGTSVLADGYLAAGDLNREQAQFVFDWGVLLQLADDLQDVDADCRDGVWTLFSQAAAGGPLDELTNRTLHFAARVMGRMRQLPGAKSPALQELIARSSVSMVLRCAGAACERYTRAYMSELEPHSPFRIAFLNERRKQLGKRSAMFARLFEAFLEGDEDEPAFPLLPSSLLPRF